MRLLRSVRSPRQHAPSPLLTSASSVQCSGCGCRYTALQGARKRADATGVIASDQHIASRVRRVTCKAATAEPAPPSARLRPPFARLCTGTCAKHILAGRAQTGVHVRWWLVHALTVYRSYLIT
jgi:hypothetical protein